MTVPVNPTANDLTLAEVDPEIAAVLDGELTRQRDTLEMIASENFVPRAILQAQGSVLTNKYAEGYPGRRYYGGCEVVDVAESLAIERAKAVFGADWANVQPHSGAQANAAVLHALANVGDTLLGLSLAHGGHLTHGMRINFSGKNYRLFRVMSDHAPEACVVHIQLLRQGLDGHSEVSRKMWARIWPQYPEKDVPITSVTNGIHFPSWVAPEMSMLYDRFLKQSWQEDPDTNNKR